MISGNTPLVPNLDSLRERLMAQFEAMVLRTGMYAVDAYAADALVRQLLGTLAYVDEVEENYRTLTRDRSSEAFGALGPPCIERWFRPLRPGHSAAAEVFSWHAELAERFGWIKVQRLSQPDWDSLRLDDLDRFRRHDHTRLSLNQQLPAPSLVVDRRILCFTPADPAGRWVFFDIAEDLDPPPWRSPGTPLRAIRQPGWARDTTVVTPHGGGELRPGELA